MQQPQIQRVTAVKLDGRPVGERYRHAELAVEVVFGPEDGITGGDLVDEVLAVFRPGDLDFEEHRRQGDIGATGPDVQDLVVAYVTGTASGLSVSGLVAAVKGLSRRWRRDPEDKMEHEEEPAPTDAEQAWDAFAGFLERAFGITRTLAQEVRATDDGWMIRARANGLTYEGTVSADGRVRTATRLGA